MRRTVMMMGMLAALITSTASLALANGRDDANADWRSNDTQCRNGTRVGVRFDGGWGSSGYGWSQERRVQNDRRFERGGSWQSGHVNDRRFDDRYDRNDRNDRYDRNDRDGWNGRGGFDGRGDDSRRPTRMPVRTERGW